MNAERVKGLFLSRTLGTPAALFLAFCAVSVAGPTNLLRNPSFETAVASGGPAYYWELGDPDHHGGTWGNVARTNWHVIQGSWGGTICGTWAGTNYGGWWQEAPAVTGQTYRFTGLFWSDARWDNYWTSTVEGIKLEFYNASTNLITAVTNNFTILAELWVGHSVEATAPASSEWVRAVIYADGVGFQGALQFDDVSLTAVGPPAPGPSSRRTAFILSEIMYHPSDRADGKDLEFVEVFNTEPVARRLGGYRLSGDADYTFSTGAVLAGLSYLVVAKDPSAVQAVYGITNVVGPYAGSLPNSEGTVRLRNDCGAVLLETEYSDGAPWPAAADGAGPSLVLSRGSYGEGDARAWSPGAAPGGSPGAAEVVASSVLTHVVINEFLAHTDLSTGDYIEVYNAGTQAVDLGGCFLSNDPATNKYRITNTVLAARSFAAWMTNELRFNLESEGGLILLRAPNSNVVDAVRYEAQENGVASGRYPDGAPGFHELAAPTKGASNAPLYIRDIVINEIMYHPITQDDDEEYVELYNRGSSNVNVGLWEFEDGITFTIPQGTVIPAGGYLVVARNKARLLVNYTNLTAGQVVGDYSGSLANSGERVALAMPHDAEDMIVVDEVLYEDGGRWGQWADGGGSSLELVDPRSDNRLAANWADSDETAKGAWTNIECTGVLDHGTNYSGASINELHVMLLKKGECLLDNVVVTNLSGPNRVTNSTFEAGLGGWTVEGDHIASGLETTGYLSSRSLHLRAHGSGDTGANRIKTGLSATLSAGSTNTLRAMGRWLCGSPHLLLRLRGNYLEAIGPLPVPANLGTPGAVNSRYAANAGPAIYDVAHTPVMPAGNEPVVVRARVHDPDGVTTNVRLRYRVDPSTTTNSVTMTNAGAGIYSAPIPGQARGAIVAFSVAATDTHASPASSKFPDDAPARECVIRWGENPDPSELGSYRFWLTKTNMDQWAARTAFSDEPLDMTFVYGNERAIYNADIRYRGSPFIRRAMQGPWTGVNSYVVSAPKDDAVLGTDELNLDTLEQWRDPTRQRERTCFWLAGRLGLPNSHQRLVRIYVNGNPHGDVYADSHHMGSDYVETWFPDDDVGDLFKIDDWFEFGSSYADFISQDSELSVYPMTNGLKKKARYRWNWEKKVNNGYDDNYSNLFNLVNAANLSNDQFTATVEAEADIGQWMRTFALRHVVSDWDGYGHNRGKNMFTYRPDGGRWNMLLWDMDFGLGADGWNSDSNLFEVAWWSLPVVNRLIGHPPFGRLYWQALYDAAVGPLASSAVNPMMDEFQGEMLRNGVSAFSPSAVESWLSARRTYILGQLTPVTNFALAITNNGGGDFSTGTNLVVLAGRAPIQLKTLKINGVEYSMAWRTVTNWSASIVLTNGTNTIVIEGYDADGNLVPGASDTIRINYTGSDVPAAGHVVIHEIMYNPLAPDASFVEIHNLSSTHAFDLAGWRLDGVDLDFEEAALVPPTGFVVAVGNRAAYAAAYSNVTAIVGEFPGALDHGGELLRLIQLNGTNPDVVVDEVIYDDDPPWPTNADGLGPSLQLVDNREDNNRVGNWAVSTNSPWSTPGQANSVTANLPPFLSLWLNEIQPSNTAGLADNFGERDPWIELYNGEAATLNLTNLYLADQYTNLARWSFGTNALVAPAGFLVVWADTQTHQTVYMTNHANFRLSTSNGTLALVCSNNGRLIIWDYMNHPAVAPARSYGDYPDGVWTNRRLFIDDSPGATNNGAGLAVRIFVNEWMADNDAFLMDPADGQYEDWFELYNAGTGAVDLSGYTLTDTLGTPGMWIVSNGVTVPGGGFLVVWADGEPQQNSNGVHSSFKLSKDGEAIGLFTPEGVPVDTVMFGAQALNVSEGRWWDGRPDLYTMAIPTPGAPNIVSTNNAPPVLAGLGSWITNEGDTLAFVVSATDTDVPAQRLWYSLGPDAPAAASIDPTNGLFTWTPDEFDGPSATSVMFLVTDNGWTNKGDEKNAAVTINEVNVPPVVGGMGDVTLNPGSCLILGVTATDTDVPPNSLSFSLDAGFPDGATIGSGDGVFQWMPSDAQASTTNFVTVRVTDTGSPNLAGTNTFLIEVTGTDVLFTADSVAGIPTAEGVTIRWAAESGKTYRVQFDTNLPGVSWSDLEGDVTATGAVATKVDTNAAEVLRFYRILKFLP